MNNDKPAATISDTEILRLLEAARDARLRAYAPYSSYHVGAALLDESGHIYGGCNVENASYGLGMCAERVAVGAAVAGGCGKPVAVAVVTADAGTPCGACRQVLVEMNPQMTVIIAAHSGDEYRVTTAAEMLPDYFSLNQRPGGGAPRA